MKIRHQSAISRQLSAINSLPGFCLFALFLSIVLISCNNGDQKKETAGEPVKAFNASKHSDVFNNGMRNVLNGYDSLKMALVDYDTTRANAAATLVKIYLDSLPLQELKPDSAGDLVVTQPLTESIKATANGLMSDTTLELKKKRFEKISDDLYKLVQHVQYDRQVIYHQHCPMAFKDEQEAYWISTSPVIVNPYLGRKHPKYKDAMLGCGDVTDSLDYSK